jgi:hypothetical protein
MPQTTPSPSEVDNLVANDPELKWTSDYFEMRESDGVKRYYVISWKDDSRLWWYRDQIVCKNPSENLLLKFVRLADRLNGFVIGDEGERYIIRRNIFFRPKVAMVKP